MANIIRDSTAGQLIRFVTRNKVLQYAEEKSDYVLPNRYKMAEQSKEKRRSDSNQNNSDGPSIPHPNAERTNSGSHNVFHERHLAPGERTDQFGRAPSEDSQATMVINENLIMRQGAAGMDPKQLKEMMQDPNVVTWYGVDDPENPLNWPMYKKGWLVFCIMLMTTSIYMASLRRLRARFTTYHIQGSSIYSPAVQVGAQYFGVGQVTSTLGISLFVVGYGVGPLFLSPISEIPAIGRTAPYIITLGIFCVLQVPTALVTNFAGFAVLRFLAGFIGSPPLATGGASIQDVFAPHKAPYAMGLYGLAAGSAPALAPVIAGFAVEAKGWRWAFWEMLWLSGFSLVLLFFGLPETSAGTILIRRARRLRKLTGNNNLKAAAEMAQEHMTGAEIAKMTLVRPLSMTFTEPIVLACNLYIGLVYAILYSYFESYPIVYAMEGYGWSLGVSNLPFIALLVGAIISYFGYCLWNKFYFEARYHETNHEAPPETRLPMACVGAFCFPISLFWFAWSANRTHWISPVISGVFFGLGTTWSFMPILTYLPHAYPEYAASVLASNDFFRSMMGAGMPLAAHGLFVNLGIDWGNSLLGFFAAAFIPIPFILIKAGPWLRKRSPMALHSDLEDDKKNESSA